MNIKGLFKRLFRKDIKGDILMDKLKAIKVKQASGQYGEAIPIGVDAANVDLINGKDLETSVTFLDEDSQETNVDFTAVKLQRDDIVNNFKSGALHS